MVYFTLAMPPFTFFNNNDNDSLNMPFIPDIPKIVDFSKGDLGIADSIYKSNISKNLFNNPSLVNNEMLQMYNDSGVIALKDDPNKYFDNDNNLKITSEDYDVPSFDGGLKAIEKTVFQTVFENMGPYVKLAISMVKVLPDIEDVVCRVLPLVFFKSAKPSYHGRSLGNKIGDVEQANGEMDAITNNYKNFNNITDENRYAGINLEELVKNDQNKTRLSYGGENDTTWEEISREYSTGEKIEGIDYKEIFRNLEDIDVNTSNNFKIPLDKDNRNLPPTIVFGMYDTSGNIETLPSFMQSDKWFGEFETLSNKSQWRRYRQSLLEYVSSEATSKYQGDQDKINQCVNFVDKNLDVKDIVNESWDYSFFKMIRNGSGDNSYNIGSDNNNLVNNITRNKGLYVPKMINYNGDNVYIDPEEYNLQIVRLIINDDKKNEKDTSLNIKTPYVGNYKGYNVEQVLETSEYLIPGMSYNQPSSGSPRRIQTRYYYSSDENRRGVYYIVEGIRNDDDQVQVNDTDTNNFYLPWDFFGGVIKFIRILIDIIIELIPQIEQLITLLSNPFGLVFDNIFKKMEKNFESFNTEIKTKFTQASNISNLIERKKYVESDPLLKKYVAVDEDYNLSLIQDGISSVDLFGFNMGIELESLVPKMRVDVVKLPVDFPKPDDIINNTSEEINNKTSYIKDALDKKYNPSDIISDNREKIEELISKAQDAINIISLIGTNDINIGNESIMALNFAQILEPSNVKLGEVTDKLKVDIGVKAQSTIDFLLGLTTLPLKIIEGVVKEFLDFFKNIGNITKLPGTIQFFNFEWFLKYIDPKFILELIGIKFNPNLMFEWLEEIKSTSSDPNKLYNLSDVFSAPFFPQLPTVDKDTLEVLSKKPLEMISSFFELIEDIINSIICFILDILNLDVLFGGCPVKKFELSKFALNNLTPEEINDLIKNPDKFKIPNEFVYDITLSDGTIIKNVDYNALEEFKLENQNYEYYNTNF